MSRYCRICRNTACANHGKDITLLGEGYQCNYIPVTTNADRIRAMSDEELAHWICKKMMSCSSNVCPGADSCQSGDGLANGLVKWLKQPAEKGD